MLSPTTLRFSKSFGNWVVTVDSVLQLITIGCKKVLRVKRSSSIFEGIWSRKRCDGPSNIIFVCSWCHGGHWKCSGWSRCQLFHWIKHRISIEILSTKAWASTRKFKENLRNHLSEEDSIEQSISLDAKKNGQHAGCYGEGTSKARCCS